MRKYYAILIISLLTLTNYGCKKDAAQLTPEVSKLEGSWKINYTDYDNYGGDKFIETTTEKDIYNSQATFSADGTGTFTSTLGQTRFSYALNGTILSFTNVKNSFANRNMWVDGGDFKYTDVKLGVNELTYTTAGSYSQPALYTRYVAKVHLVK